MPHATVCLAPPPDGFCLSSSAEISSALNCFSSDFGFEEALITGRVVGGLLQTETFTRFSDGSGRASYVSRDTFAPAAAAA